MTYGHRNAASDDTTVRRHLETNTVICQGASWPRSSRPSDSGRGQGLEHGISAICVLSCGPGRRCRLQTFQASLRSCARLHSAWHLRDLAGCHAAQAADAFWQAFRHLGDLTLGPTEIIARHLEQVYVDTRRSRPRCASGRRWIWAQSGASRSKLRRAGRLWAAHQFNTVRDSPGF